MLRFNPGHKISENFYVRQDGTRAYYFTIGKKYVYCTVQNFIFKIRNSTDILLDCLVNVCNKISEHFVMIFYTDIEDFNIYLYIITSRHQIKKINKLITLSIYCVLCRLSDHLQQLAHSAGFKTISCDYVHRQTVNKKEGLSVPRIFVQAKFVKCGEINSDCKS